MTHIHRIVSLVKSDKAVESKGGINFRECIRSTVDAEVMESHGSGSIPVRLTGGGGITRRSSRDQGLVEEEQWYRTKT